MQKHILSVFFSFSGVVFIIMFGTNIAYRTNIIPEIKRDFYAKNTALNKVNDDLNIVVAKLENELDIARKKQEEAETKLKEKLVDEERIALEKTQAKERARIAAANAQAAEAARLAAAKNKKVNSKKSKAS